LFYLLFLVFFVVCVALVWFVLVQEPKQGGLSSSLGGGGDLFGGRGVAGGLVRLTVILGGLFMGLAVILNVLPR
jgi:preprotein translocase subunit SecG